jgi:serralysin
MVNNRNQAKSSTEETVQFCREPNIVEVLKQESGGQYDANNQDFDIFLNALQDTGLTESLAGKNTDLTVFAPTDEAFLKLSRFFGYGGNSEAEVPDVINKELTESNQFNIDNGGSDPNLFNLRDILLYHLTKGAKSSTELESLAGVEKILETSIDNAPNAATPSIFYNEGTLSDRSPNTINPNLKTDLTDLSASNGILHGIDRVLFPYFLAGKYPIPPAELPNSDTPLTIADALAQSGGKFDDNRQDFDILNKLLQTAELTNIFADPNTNLTLFAPTDDAFIKFDEFTRGNPGPYPDSQEELAYAQIISFFEIGDAALTQALAQLPVPLEISGDSVGSLQNVLKYHVSTGAQTAAEIQVATDHISTLLENSTINVEDGKLVDQLANFTDPQLQAGKTDIITSNGIIQGIDNVLLPNLFGSFLPPSSKPLLQSAPAPIIADAIPQSGSESDNSDIDGVLLSRNVSKDGSPNGEGVEGGRETDLVLGNSGQEKIQGNEDDLLFGGVNPYLLKGGTEFDNAEGGNQMFGEAKEGELLFRIYQDDMAILNPMTLLGSLGSTQGENFRFTESEKDLSANLSSRLISPLVSENSFIGE